MRKELLSQRQVENGIDSLITEIITCLEVEERNKKIERFRIAIKIFEREKYNMKKYKGIYEEFKNNFNDYDNIDRR